LRDPQDNFSRAGIHRGNWTESDEPQRQSTILGLRMKIVRTVSELRSALEPVRRATPHRPIHARAVAGIEGANGVGTTIGLVPTMGALHEGHLSLIGSARAQCEYVVVSLFVNPAQFEEGADLALYPRREAEDARLAEGAGADILFAPSSEEVYPEGFSTAVEVFGLTDRLEGASRGASHFRGVTTVVTKLLCMVGPDVAYFGQKDAQQVVVIRRLVADLNLPVRVEVCPTMREADGLAMSSRNALLSPEDRERALALGAALRAAAASAGKGERSAATLLAAAADAMAPFGVEPEYLALVDPDTFEPVARLEAPALLAVAARVGATRLIDNETLYPVLRPVPQPPMQLTSNRTAVSVPQPAVRTPDPDQPDPREAQTTCSA
jgi:pantoate--beta-alanine ligase